MTNIEPVNKLVTEKWPTQERYATVYTFYSGIPTTVTNETSYGRVVQYLPLRYPIHNFAFTSTEFIRSDVSGKICTRTQKEIDIHEYLGPARTMTHRGCSYFLTIIYERRVWIYVLKNKGDIFEKFKELHTQIGTKLKCLRIDNGLEFVLEQFNNFCKKLGIRRHKTVVETPQHNGLVERMNRTILERIRCMLLSAGLPKAFWGCPSSAIGFKTLMELWNGKLANYSNLKVCSVLAFVHVKQDKLEARAIRCAFIGYPLGIKGYKL
ncbi:hypothetical protein CR513_08919, partial [Mucuna pruriens]